MGSEMCIRDRDDDGKIVKKTIREKRVCTYNPKLVRKKLMEIDKMVEKARNLKTYSAKKVNMENLENI